jgi:hypothetical protein
MTYMQTLLTPDGFSLDYQDGSLFEHYRTKRSDLSAEEIIEAFCDYSDGKSTWTDRFEFERIELRLPSFHIGYFLAGWPGALHDSLRQEDDHA